MILEDIYTHEILTKQLQFHFLFTEFYLSESRLLNQIDIYQTK